MASGNELRQAMRRFPAGICVVTVDADGQKLGLTVGSLVSVSLEPALVAVSIGLHTPLHEPLRQSRRFVVSLLGADQDWLAQHFARNPPPIVAWANIPTRQSPFPEPQLADALAWLECRTWAEYDAGDHTLFVGEVLSVEFGRSAPALVYREGRYVGVD